MKPKFLLLPLAITLAYSITARADEYTWDTNAAAGIQTGTHNWATTATNWTLDGGTNRVGWPNTGTDSAYFQGPITADITVSINSTDIQVDDLRTGTTSKYIYLNQASNASIIRTLTLTGGTYDGTGTTGSQFDIAGGGSLSITGAVGTTQFRLTGTSDLVKTGSGSLFITSKGHDFTGNIHINQGNLFVNSGDDTSLGNAANDIFVNGGTLNLQNNALTLGSGRTVTLTASGGNIGGTADLTLQGPITGAGSLNKVSSGALNLDAVCDYAGTTTISAGVLRPQGSGTIPSASDLTINGSGNFNVRNTTGWVYNGTITGDGTGQINLNTGTDAELAGNISGVPTLNVNTAGTDTTVSGDISGTVNLTVQGGAILTLSGDNSAMSGSVTVNGSTSGTQLNIDSATALGTGTFTVTGGTGKIDNTSGSALTLSTNNAQAWNNNLTFVGTDALNLGTGAVTLGGNRSITVTNTLTVGGDIGDGGSGYGITKSGWGNLVLDGTNTYTGATVITQSSLTVASIKDYGVASAIGAPLSGSIQLGNANDFCNLVYTGSGDSTNRTVQFGNTGAANTGLGSIKNNGTGALTFTAANLNPTISGITETRTLWLGGTYTGASNEIQGIIQDNDAGAGGLISVGKGNDDSTWTLSGANTYTGSTIVQGGALKLGASGSIASSTALFLSAGATLDTSAQASFSIPGTQPVSFGINAASSGSSGTIAAAGLDVSSATATYSITGTPDDPVYVLATYTSLTGTFASVDAPPAGYTLDYAYEGNKIALVQSSGSPYDTWSGGEPFDGDKNGDGVSNGLAFLLGAADPDVSALDKLPSVTSSGGGLVLTFSMLESSSRGGATLSIEHSSDIGISDPWTTVAVPDSNGGPTGGVTFAVSGSGTLNVVATIGSGEADGGNLFGRLKAENP